MIIGRQAGRAALLGLGTLALLAAGTAQAVIRDFDALGGFRLDWDNKISAGLQLRTQNPKTDLIGKASLPQNRLLCAPDDCISVDPDDTAPNERFLAAPGATASFTDDGNLNYPDRLDVTAATTKWLSKMTFRFGQRGVFDNLGVELGWLGFYDPVNTNFTETHPNEIVAPGPQPGQRVTSRRDPQNEEILGYDFDIREANVFFRVPFFGDRELDVKIGRQQLPWGEGLIALRGSLNFINPPEFTNLLRPGFELNELYRPVGMARFNTFLTDRLELEAFYQFEWRPYGIPAKGGLVSFFDASNEVADDDVIPLPFSKTPDDPNQLQTPADDVVNLVTDTSFAARRAPNQEPANGGQYGLHLSWFVDGIGQNGLDLGFYYANYHSRIPLVGATATDATCARREGNPLGIDPTNVAEFFLACGVDPLGFAAGGNLTERDALPLDTAQFFLEYPEDIEIFGLSYNTIFKNWAWQGEIAWRPNLPVQVDIEDVLFAAFQPVFPRNTIPLAPNIAGGLDPDELCSTLGGITSLAGALCSGAQGTLGDVLDLAGIPDVTGLEGATLANSQRALPDFVTRYRGGVPGEVIPGQEISGYERLNNITTSFNFTRVLGGDYVPFGADQFIFIADLATSWLPDLPSRRELQFEAQGTLTHASPGIAETGDALKINPIQTRDGFVTEFAWGYRFATLFSYENTPWPGANLRPLIAVFHDVDGVSPGLAANLIEGRKIIFLDLELQDGHWTYNLTQVMFAGGGNNNILTDRDNLTFSVGYEF